MGKILSELKNIIFDAVSDEVNRPSMKKSDDANIDNFGVDYTDVLDVTPGKNRSQSFEIDDDGNMSTITTSIWSPK